MPKSLDRGPSKSVQIKCPEADKAAIVAVLRDGETLSELTRRLWSQEVLRRKDSPQVTQKTGGDAAVSDFKVPSW